MTRMFNKGVPEKVIAEKSGHRSLEALRCYEHTSSELEKAAGKMIANPEEEFSVGKSERKEVPSAAQNIPGISGSMENCTINFNITYGSK